MENIILKLLDWPFLLFVFLCFFVAIFKKQLLGILNRGDITVSWGKDRTIRLRELSDSLDEELDPIREDIRALKDDLEMLKERGQGKGVALQSSAGISSDKTAALKRMKDALADGRFRWRSLERLAIIGALNEDNAVDLLRSDPEVVFSLGKSGRRIARLQMR